MTSLVTVVNYLSKLNTRNPGVLFTAVRNHWNKDFQPGPYPTTVEERVKAAKKYGLTLAEYEPYSDDGMGHGDYPKLPLISSEQKDPYYPYDFPELKRNFNEPVHVHAEMIGEDRYDLTIKLRWPILWQVLTFLGVMGGVGAVYLFLERMRMHRPVLPKQYPKAGQKHYTFDSK